MIYRFHVSFYLFRKCTLQYLITPSVNCCKFLLLPFYLFIRLLYSSELQKYSTAAFILKIKNCLTILLRCFRHACKVGHFQTWKLLSIYVTCLTLLVFLHSTHNLSIWNSCVCRYIVYALHNVHTCSFPVVSELVS